MQRSTPEAHEECQPVTSEDQSLALVMDGRLDNWVELRIELLARGVRLRNRSDAELVLRTYEAWGRSCVDHLDGDFAFLVWNARSREVFCARDRLGEKPFFYRWDGGTLTVASEPAALHAAGGPWRLNANLVAEYLAGEWYSRDETLWNGVMRLVAAHRMVVTGRGPDIDCYWQPRLDETLPCRTDNDYFEHYRELFADCVRRAARSDRPVACEVSGGIDSSAVFCMAEQLRRQGRLPAPGIKGYTMVFDAGTDADEIEYARAVGNHLGVDVHGVAASLQPVSWFIERASREMDVPGFPNQATSEGLYREVCAGGLCAVLTGEGGDERLTGSRAYYAEALMQRDWSSLKAGLAEDVAAFGLAKPIGWFLRNGVLQCVPEPIRDGLRRIARSIRRGLKKEPEWRIAAQSRYWLSSDMRQLIEQRCRQSRIDGSANDRKCSPGQAAMLRFLHYAFSTHVTEHMERLGASTGIELRSPMRNYKFVQFAFSTPEALRMRGKTAKYIHVKALAGLVPRAVLERQDKAEFSFVVRRLIDQQRDVLTDTIPRQHANLVDLDGMARLYEAYSRNAQDGWPLWILWSIFSIHLLSREQAVEPASSS